MSPGKPANLEGFLRESLAIEGIHRRPNAAELKGTRSFLALGRIDGVDVCNLQAIHAPEMPLRTLPGMNVRVGRYVAPPGGPDIAVRLQLICNDVSRNSVNVWKAHIAFENLHPFMDGNGRTGRTLWAWHMRSVGMDPFGLPFLHRFYYQTLAAQG